MQTKIKWFKEVLELEPGSKVFFPLARLYFDDNKFKDARDTLRHGLDRNPDHLEARFLMVEVLTRLEQHDEAVEEVRIVTGMLSSYPAFWKLWAESAAPASKDSAMALTFLAANFQGSPISWTQVIEKGLDSIFQSNGASAPAAPVEKPKPAKPKSTPPMAPVASCEDDASLRTRTMADLLADQGDFQGALTIYEELAVSCAVGEGDELEALIEKMRVKLKKGKRVESKEAEPATWEGEKGTVVLPGSEAAVEAVNGVVEETENVEVSEVQTVASDVVEESAPEPAVAVDEVEAETPEVEVASEPEPVLDTEPLAEDDVVPEVDVEMAAVEVLEDSVVASASVAEEKEPDTVEEAVAKSMPGREKLLETLESLADRLEARSAL